ncbi:hypothetical protein EAW52_10995 [Pseudomonas sp. LTJR-52]|uniref:AAA family ATPase n=1 Tax=Pseudomonas sp. LTJR-52 TaxID=2479392 RepID=UPI000EFCB599|nr:AAA family ATPase [Pseudomonas sp. LTJR-52]AYN94448.1 hypothetical protein EAW52_10995 [Pseudomonas sp. LTJR-52]
MNSVRTFEPNSNIPEALRERANWICWSYVEKSPGAKPDKVPCHPDKMFALSWDKPSAWMSYEEAVAAYERNLKLSGIGLALTGGLVGIDIDHCLDKQTGQFEPWALEHIREFQTYTEVSPSGEGIRMFIEGSLPEGCRKKSGPREIYDSGRWLTVTGKAIDDSPVAKDRQGAVSHYLQAMQPSKTGIASEAGDSNESLVVSILTGQNLHDSTRNLAFRYIADGMTPGKVVETVRGFMLAMNDRGDPARWQARYDDIPNLVRSAQAKIPAAKVEAAVNNAFDLDAARVTPDWFTAEPPAREWLVKDLLPHGVVGILAAPGGAGKSLLLQQLSLAVASGTSFLGCEIQKPGAVVYLSAEDDQNELRRRLYAIGKQYPGIDTASVARNLYMLDLVSAGFKLTHSPDGGRVITTNALLIEQLRQFIQSIGNVQLVIVDTYSRFNGGEENDNVHSATFVQACEMIRKDTGCNVMVSAHTTKATMGTVKATDVAGGARLVDSARWMGGLDRYLYAKDSEPTPEDARHVRLTVGKSNYGQIGAQFYLEFCNGALLHRDKAAKRESSDTVEKKRTSRYEEALPKVKAFILQKQAEGKSVTRELLRTYADTFGMSEKTLREQVINRAIEEGELLETVVSSKKRLITVWNREA